MSKYRTLEEVVVDGVGVGAGNDIELSEEQAAALEGKVTKLGEDGEPEAAPAPEAAPEAAPEDQG